MKRTSVVRIITFSGIDGAGKSTQIEHLCALRESQRFAVARIAFWDDVAVLPSLRTGLSLRVLGKKQEPTETSSLRSDKNIRRWYLSLIRAGFYVLDALRFRIVLAQLRRGQFDFIIVDRCCYDQLVHVRTKQWLARTFIKLVVKLAPQPDVSLLLDASPDEAFGRKPEYPLSFMHEYRQSYLKLRDLIPHLTVIPPTTIEEVREQIAERVLRGIESLEHQQRCILQTNLSP